MKSHTVVLVHCCLYSRKCTICWFLLFPFPDGSAADSEAKLEGSMCQLAWQVCAGGREWCACAGVGGGGVHVHG